MSRTPLFFFATAALAGCATSFQAEGLDLPEDAVEYAFLQTRSYEYDRDRDGKADASVRGLGITITDRADLCDVAATTPVDELDDVYAVQVVALAAHGGSTFETNASLTEILFETSDGDAFVGMRVIERSGGETVAHYATKNIADPVMEVRSKLSIGSQRVVDGEVERMSTSFSGLLQADLVDEASFDVDVNDDAVNDYRAMKAAFKGRAKDVVLCDAIEVLP